MEIAVARRNFKSLGQQFLAGQIIEERESVRRFRSKVSEGQIWLLDTDAADYPSYVHFFKEKYNIDLPQPAGEAAQVAPPKVTPTKPVAPKAPVAKGV